MKRHSRFAATCLAGALLAMGTLPAGAATPAQDAGLTQAQLDNATYLSSYTTSGEITLVNGMAEEELAPDSASMLKVTLTPPTAFGDLNGDGVADAAVLLATETGGSGTFVDLHAVLDENGEPVDAASVFLGDRVQVKSLTIAEGIVVVDMVAHGPSDPMCCPTMEEQHAYQLVDGALVEVSDGELSLETLDDLTYLSEDFPEGAVTLSDGAIEVESAPGAASPIRIERTGYAAFGDLNGDDVDDIAGVLVSDGGGSGSFYYLAAATVGEEGLTDAATILLGDRVIINDLVIEDGVIVVDMVNHGPDDPMCCPTQHVVQSYVLEDGALVLTNETVIPAETGDATFQPDAEPFAATLTLGGESFWLDPTLVSVIGGVAGGQPVNASTVDAACAGNIGARPDVVLDWAGDDEVETLRLFLLSMGDPTLLVVTPDGEVLCNDDYSPLMADPFVTIDAPAPGRYAIFAGSFENDAVAPGFLVVTSHDLNPAIMDLAAMFPRQTNPDALRNPQSADVMEVDAEPQAAAAAPVTPESTPVTQTLTAGGSLGAFDVELGNEACTGFITATPAFTFEWEGNAGDFALYFEAGSDSTLLVRDPDGAYHCGDDVAGADNLNPVVVLPSVAGTYQVWAGSYSPDATFEGVLTITSDASAQPAPLTTDMIEQ